MDRVLYLDLVGGAAGDMLMAALIDAGASADAIRSAHRALGLTDVELVLNEVQSAGLRALQADVMIRGELADQGPPVGPTLLEGRKGHGHHRPYVLIRERLEQADLPPPVRALAQDAFLHLAQAEAHVHGASVEEVQFHEVGADDAIADIVGVATALHDLGLRIPGAVSVSPVPMGRGLVRGAHGPIPLPGPAALQILTGAPLVPAGDGETVTPTGAALLRAMQPRFGGLTAMTLERVGVGAGHRQWPDRPNVVRALLGRTDGAAAAGERMAVVECQVDDLMPLHLPDVLQTVLDAGAADAWAEPLYMKKGRPGLKLSALCSASVVEAAADALFRASPTLGVRIHPVDRRVLPRTMITVDTEYGEVRVKVAERPGGVRTAAPEADDCARLARERGVPERQVYLAALQCAEADR